MKWTEDQIKELKEKYSYYIEHRKEAEEYFKRNWSAINTEALHLEIKLKNYPLIRIKNKKCSMFLGCHVAERVLGYVFKNVERMSFNNPGYDFICNKGKKIDVKSTCLYNNHYIFIINYNKIADYFLCIGFDNRENLNPQHIWLINSNDFYFHKTYKKLDYRQFKDTSNICIHLSKLEDYSKYELTDKLKETIECCTELKSDKPKVKLIRLRRKSK